MKDGKANNDYLVGRRFDRHVRGVLRRPDGVDCHQPGQPLNGQTGASVALLALSLIVAFIGVTLQLVAWIGALFNSHLLADKMWFNVLLWIGIVGIVTSSIVIGGLLC